MDLQEGVPISGMVNKDQVMNYIFAAHGNQEREIEVILTNFSGNPDLFVKLTQNDSYTSWGIEKEEI